MGDNRRSTRDVDGVMGKWGETGRPKIRGKGHGWSKANDDVLCMGQWPHERKKTISWAIQERGLDVCMDLGFIGLETATSRAEGCWAWPAWPGL